MSDIHPDLEWIAKNTDKWGGTLIRNLVSVDKETGEVDYFSANYYNIDNVETFTQSQYLHARHVLGLDDDTKEESNMNPNLEWLARNVSEWPGTKYVSLYKGSMICAREPFPGAVSFMYPQWLQARQDLGLVMTEEEEAMPAKEHRNKYMREIKPGVWVDVYDVLNAWAVKNPALQHLIKKALQPGQRGHKTLDQDMNDIVASAERARELEE